MGNNRCPKCQFYGCNALGVVAVPIDRRGGGNAYLCLEHSRGRRLNPYSSENPIRIGEPKKNGLTYSMEFEMDRPTAKAICELGIAAFSGTHDCTVDMEAKSPIYNGANGLKAILPQLEKLQTNCELDVSERCGTHLHIGRVDYGERERDSLLPFYWIIHGRLWRAMNNDEEKATRIFGRGEGRWAFGASDADSWYYRAIRLNEGYATRDALEAHPAFLNVQHEPTLEWRRCKFITATQYSECIDLCRALSNKIFDFASEIVTAKRSGCYDFVTFEAKAKKLGNKLAKIFKEW